MVILNSAVWLIVPVHLQFTERNTKPIHQSIYRCMKPFIHSTYLDDLWKCNFPNLLRVRPHHGSPTAVKPKHLHRTAPLYTAIALHICRSRSLIWSMRQLSSCQPRSPKSFVFIYICCCPMCRNIQTNRFQHIRNGETETQMSLRTYWGHKSHYLHIITENMQK